MAAIKLSVTIEPSLAQFARTYQQRHQVATQSEVIELALKALRDEELERAYEEAALEYASDPDFALWENTVGDGIKS
jgi:antitoxin ParD1/3/4